MSGWQFKPQQKDAYRAGALIGVVTLVLMLLPMGKAYQQPGPDNTGHTDMECDACHLPGDPGEGWFVHGPVNANQCLDCHDNPNDRHPVARFEEPEFTLAREAIAPHNCTSCHRQHAGKRATPEPGFCQHCHQQLVMDEDPVDVPHEQLVSDGQWRTCLGCHDFHGNHEGEVPLKLTHRYSDQQIQDYLDGGNSPYGYRNLTVMQTMRVKQD